MTFVFQMPTNVSREVLIAIKTPTAPTQLVVTRANAIQVILATDTGVVSIQVAVTLET